MVYAVALPPKRLTGPAQFFDKLLTIWQLNRKQGAILLGREQSYVYRFLRGNVVLEGRDTTDRMACLFRIRKVLSALFRDEKVENEWLREPHDLLNGRTPMELLLEGSMENMLTVKEYVDAAAGR